MSGKFEVYKKSAAAQISLIEPSYNDQGWLTKNGAVLVEATVSTGKDANDRPVFDWTQKISVALGVNDLCLLFGDISKQLTHEYKESIKGFQFQPGEGQYEGTFRMILSVKEGEAARRQVMVPLSSGEMQYLGRLFDIATTRMLGW